MQAIRVHDFGGLDSLVLPWQRGLAFSLGRLVHNNKPPSPKQAAHGLKILDESERRGFRADT
jgi:hypothetical protein